MSNEETRKTYRLTANKTKLYALAKRIYPNIEPMKNTDFIKYYRVRDYALEFWSGEHFHHLFLSVCGGKARLADRWSTYDENDERTEHWECRAMTVYTVVIAFYFGTQTQKISDAVAQNEEGKS